MRIKHLAALVGAALLALPLPAAHAAPGDNGDVKTHNVGTAVSDTRDEPKVCDFYLDAFNFDGYQRVNYHFEQGPEFKGPALQPGQITLDNVGDGHTGTLHLDAGQYKLFFLPEGANGADKHKVFVVECDQISPSPTPIPSVTESPVPTPVPTATETPTAEPTPTNTVVPTNAPSPTVSPTPTPTVSPTHHPVVPPHHGKRKKLPVTGDYTLTMGLAGGGMLLTGAGAMLFGRRRV